MDLAKREEEILAFWQKNKIFEKSIAQRKRGRRFVFYDGPPFATGQPHYGHIVASIIKDAIPRYQTMQGKYVERRWGWDCHGLPLENIIEQELKLKTKKDILAYGIDKFNQYAKEQVLRYADDWKKVIPRIGRWVDMDKSYRTMDWQYTETIWWIFKTLYEKGLIYEGYKSMHICPRCETTLANFEVSQGYKKITDLSVYVKFELEKDQSIYKSWRWIKPDDHIYVLAWTTTPWTLPGNVALAIKREVKYVIFRQKKNQGPWFISALSARHPVYILGEVNPEEVLELTEDEVEVLLRQHYKPLFNYYSSDPNFKNRQNGWKIYPADFVSTEEGTGIVHIAPAFGEEDMALGQKYDLPFVQHITMDGKFKPEVKDFAGLPVKPKEDHQVTDKKIIEYLEKHNLLFARRPIPHSYPRCWRCETPLLNYAASSWFVKVTEIKKDLIPNNKKIHWVPAHIKEGRFGKWLEGSRDWAISRQRFWGAPIPVWKCKNCGKQEVIGSLRELEKESPGALDTYLKDQNGERELHRPHIDAVKLSCSCGGAMERVPEVFDCWFESGSMPYGQWHYPFENKVRFDPTKRRGFPADFIAEGIDMTRGWFYSLLVMSTTLFKETAYKNVIAYGIVLAQDGQKMSKRLKNYPDPMDVVAKYGADALRFYLLSQPVVQGEDLNFSLKELDEVYKKYNLIVANTLNFYTLYKHQTPRGVKSQRPNVKGSVLDRWVLSRLSGTIETVTAALEVYELIPVTRALMDFVQDLSVWYVRRSRERVKSGGPDAAAALATLRSVLYDLARLMAPVTPFLAEMIYQELRSKSKVKSQKSKVSVHLEDWPKANRRLINKKLEGDMALAREIVSQALRLRAEAGIRVRQPLSQLKVQSQKLKVTGELLDLVKDEVNVKEVIADSKIKTDVELDTRITPELREEGMLRELVRAVQDLRKKSGLKPQARCTVSVYGLAGAFLKRQKGALESATNSTLIPAAEPRPSQFQGPASYVMIEGNEVVLTVKVSGNFLLFDNGRRQTRRT